MRALIGVVVYPGTNCELDVAAALATVGAEVSTIWHTEEHLGDVDGVVLPGGFAHGDYLRPGAIARFSPVTADLCRAAEAGLPVLGICNGFQVLTEAGLLPGALQRNIGLEFVCDWVTLRVDSTASVLTAGLRRGERLRLPINHFSGAYRCEWDVLETLRRDDRVVLRYEGNPNGSLDDVAGVTNAARNVVGLMPHPERAVHELLGGTDGLALLEAFVRSADAYARTGASLAPERIGR
jgi:phosphoribosylformylglycinamidine synthase I